MVWSIIWIQNWKIMAHGNRVKNTTIWWGSNSWRTQQGFPRYFIPAGHSLALKLRKACFRLLIVEPWGFEYPRCTWINKKCRTRRHFLLILAHPEGLFNSHTINRVGPFSPRKIQTAQGLFSSTIGSNPEGSNPRMCSTN